MVERFEQQVDAFPGLDAIRHLSDEQLKITTFSQLDSWANAIAWELISRRGTVSEPVPLAICAPELMLAAALGVLKAGKFYAAVNAMHPVSRVERVLNELDAPLLVCDGRGGIVIPRSRRVLSIEEIIATRSPAGRPGLRFDEERLAYVLYTSGSTGRPRGVAQSRRDMLHNVARHRPLAVGRGDCMSLISADGFVASISNPYVALLEGAALAPYSFREQGVDRLMSWLDAAVVTVVYMFPSFLRQLATFQQERTNDRVRLAYLGGETVLPSDLMAARRLFPSALLSVGLNSSETGLTCLHLIPPGAPLPDAVPVGRPVLDVDVSIVDLHGSPVPPGVPGEIEIRSDYVRPRYWPHVSATTQERVSQPALRTGDRGRIDADGLVYHLGRSDGMVKIRGYRVELAEVEAAIAAIEGVAEVAVFADEGPPPATTELVACIIVNDPGIDEKCVREAVARELPAAMVPTRVVNVTTLPRTLNGKLDRKGLARLADASQNGAAGVKPIADSSVGNATRASSLAGNARHREQASPIRDALEPLLSDLIEQRIAEIWRSTLEVDEVGLEEDFFMLGGTSIDAVSVIATIRERLGARIALRALFRTPTVRGLAQALIAVGVEASND